jgi:hypothetical protein
MGERKTNFISKLKSGERNRKPEGIELTTQQVST